MFLLHVRYMKEDFRRLRRESCIHRILGWVSEHHHEAEYIRSVSHRFDKNADRTGIQDFKDKEAIKVADLPV